MELLMRLIYEIDGKIVMVDKRSEREINDESIIG